MILLAGNVSPAAGGIERTLEHVSRELRAAGHEVGFLEIAPGSAPEGARPIPVEVEWGRGPTALANPFRLGRAVADAVEGVAGEVEQLWARSATVAGVVARSHPGLSMVFIPPGTLRSIAPWERRLRGGGFAAGLKNVAWRLWYEPISFRRERRALVGARGVVVFSENMRRMIADDYGEAVAARVEVIPPGVDGDRFRPSEGARRRGVVFLGRLAHRKGAGLLVEAVARLPGVPLTVVGDGPVRGELEARVRARGMAERVRFTGHVDEPGPLVGEHRVMAVPSVLEPFGHVMLEGLAAGCPVVGFSRASGARTAVEDVVEDGVNGALVHERTPAALADGLGRALALAERPGVPDRCREEALRRYRWDRFVARVLDVGG